MRRLVLIASLIMILIFPQTQLAAKVTTPEEFLGFYPGTDRKIADMHQIYQYFKLLSQQSDRVKFQELGKTTENNPFFAVIITSEENQKQLDELQNYQLLLSDARKINPQQAEKIISEKAKTIVMINCSIHATEIGASQMSLLLAYDLATKNSKDVNTILDNVILLLIPMHNPDGIQKVADWYRKYVGTKYEGAPMPWLYQKYVGHDNNRDWYMFTQVESRLTLKIHNAWHPQIVVDMHQAGSRGARLFVPPYVDPFEPNVDPILQQEISMMGTFIAAELTAQGKAGVEHSQRYDAWTPARAYHHYHGGVRILTECASIRIASPITIEPHELNARVKQSRINLPMPWLGGKWTLRDIVDYDYAAAFAALTNAALLREQWLRNYYQISLNAINRKSPPFAFVIPNVQRDISTTLKMLEVFKLAMVEIHRAKAEFAAGGKIFPAGSYIIYLNQPYGSFAKALLERQHYPELRDYPGGPLKPPYDVVAHTLPLLMGVDVMQVDSAFEADVELLASLPEGKSSISGSPGKFYGYYWDSSTNDAIVAAERLLKNGFQIYRTADSFEVGGRILDAGTFLIKNDNFTEKTLKQVGRSLSLKFEPLKVKPDVRIFELKKNRVGIYRSWVPSIDEGWTRWVLEQFEIPYQRLENKAIKNGNLNKKIDVLIIPDMQERIIVKGRSEKTVPPEYAGGIGTTGVQRIIDFVENGGTLITINRAAGFAIKYFKMNIVDSSRSWSRKDFYCPGSILLARLDNRHPVAFGFQTTNPIFFRSSPVFSISEGTPIITYPNEELLLSGWINGENHLSGKSAVVEVKRGKGRIILIGFPVLYRGQAHSTFRILFNSILYGCSSVRKL